MASLVSLTFSMVLCFLFLLFSFPSDSVADIFMHNPRGSQNRYEQAQTIQTGTRLFNTRNINEGGYNAPSGQRSLSYYAGSTLSIEWAVNSGCGSNTVGGGPNGAHCDIILQYMCSDEVRDGTTGDTIPDDLTYNTKTTILFKYGMHENYQYYQSCKGTPRNLGLYTGDNFFARGATSAVFTRQNPGGQRFGFECPEERDYYPYWMPSPWRDIAIITDTPSRCPYYKAQSANVLKRCFCDSNTTNSIDQASCANNKWTCFPSWSDRFGIDAPDCIEAPWTNENSLSNTMDGNFMRYNWTIPNLPADSCVLRIRYNVTAGDFPAWPLNLWDGPASLPNSSWLTADFNSQAKNPYPAFPNSNCCVWSSSTPCQCTLLMYPVNLPSVVFQDRSHRFSILERPPTVKNIIHNLNVRGRRGNIVQTFPAVEYDFVPQVLNCRVGEWIHIQWTGNDNNKKDNGNDPAGEGLKFSDRSNMIQMQGYKYNYPISSTSLQNLLSTPNSMRLAFNDLHLKEKTHCENVENMQNENTRDQLGKNCAKLNPNLPFFDAGLQPCRTPGTYYFVSTRNNNFSNRSQKGVIVMLPCEQGNLNCSNADSISVDAKNGDFQFISPASHSSSISAVALLVCVVIMSYFL